MTSGIEINARTAGEAVRACLLAAVALLIGLLALVSPAVAGPPSHPALPALDIAGFDHACGAAVDTEGDVYVASAGESEIRIFDPSHTELTSISNGNEPCGLAVDSKGNLYVSEGKTGNVVRYAPNAYPFVGAPTYGAPTTIDGSGLARGMAVDTFDDRIYVAKGDRIDAYESDGSFAASIGIGELSEATGVAAYTYRSGELYVSAADAATDVIKVFSGGSVLSLDLRRTIDGSDKDAFNADRTPDNGLGLAADVSLTADRASGHVFVYDDDHEVVDEFEATGEFITQISDPEFADAEPTAIAVFPERNEIQTLEISCCTGGTFTLSFEGDTTDPIPATAASIKIQEQLEALATIGSGNVAVGGSPPGAVAGRHSIAFVEDLGGRDVEQLVLDASGITGGSATLSTTIQGSGPGRVYVTAGAGPGAKLLAFAPLVDASRPPVEALSFTLKTARSVAVDLHGNRYVSAGASIGVYPPSGNTPMATISDPGKPYDLAVDSACNVYALDENTGLEKETVVYFTPTSCPPKPGTKYSGPTTVATAEPPFFEVDDRLLGIGIDPNSDRLYVAQRSGQVIRLKSVKEGSGIDNPDWGSGLFGGLDIDVCGASGNVYASVTNGTEIAVINSAGTEVLARINGLGSPKGTLNPRTSIAINHANCHVVAFANSRGVVEEYEASGAFVAEFGAFSTAFVVTGYGIAIDNSCSLKPALAKPACEASDPAYGNVYVAFDDPAGGTFDLTAFGLLSYGAPPVVLTGTASGVGGGKATVHGTVNPGGFAIEDCHFEYLTDAQYLGNGETFAGATVKPCAESAATIGKGTKPVPVHAEISSLEPEGRYRFRLVAGNTYGSSNGEAGVFGPPLLTLRSAQPISYVEATLRAIVDPSGLSTEYRFEYGTSEAYGQLTPLTTLPADAGPTEVEVPIFGLAEGTRYHFRVVAENEVKAVSGPDQEFETQERAPPELCPNSEFRTGPSANLPDCRAYELVSPAETRGLTPSETENPNHQFSNRLVSPEGERVSFFVNGTLPGFDGNGILDGYRAVRTQSEGLHPKAGWQSQLFSPTYADAPARLDARSNQEGVSPDQEYSFWTVPPVEGTLQAGTHLRTPTNFEPLGRGSLGADLGAFSHYASAGGTHVIFSSKAHLEPTSAPALTQAIYDRSAGEAISEVVSIRPDGSPFGAGENATYVGSTDDGSTVAFKVGGALYLRRDGTETVQVAAAPNTFAGLSADGDRVFYVGAAVSGDAPAAADLFACDVAIGGCAGPGAHAPIEIAVKSRFVHVPAGGIRAYFTSTEELDDALEGVPGEDNLYLWEAAGEAVRFIGLLDPGDFAVKGFQGIHDNLVRWPDAIDGSGARALSPTRSTPDGSVLVFQSHAQLTAYDNAEATAGACGDPEAVGDPCPEVYRYDSEAAPGKQLACVSCDPTGAPPVAPAAPQELRAGSSVSSHTLISSVTDDGTTVFFQGEAPLLPEDSNSVQDVYKWVAQGTGGCKRQAGCLALISSGQSERDSYLYGMTADGSDVFITTLEKLHGADVAGSPSIYDARVEGGIPDPPLPAPCQGDACQGQGSLPPSLPVPSSGISGGDTGSRPPLRCPKGKRKVRRNGKTRCVKAPHKKTSKRHKKGRAAR